MRFRWVPRSPHDLAWGYIYLGLMAAGLMGATLILETHRLPCIFKSITGLPCPSCGTGRQILALTQGHFQDAFLANPAAFVLAATVVTFFALDCWGHARGVKPSLQIQPGFRRKLILYVSLIVILNWWYLILRGT